MNEPDTHPSRPDKGTSKSHLNDNAEPADNRASADMFDPEQMRQHADSAARLLKALANEKRLMILCLLAEGERSVSELNTMLDLSQSALSQHLAVLRDEQLVKTRRDAQSVLYSLAPGPAFDVIQTLHGIYCAPSGPVRNSQ